MTSVLRVPASFFVWGGSDPSLQCQSPRRQQDWCSNMVAVCSVEGMLTLSWLWDLANTVVSRGHSRGCPVLRIYWIWAGITEHHWSDMAAVQCLLWMAANQQSDISRGPLAAGPWCWVSLGYGRRGWCGDKQCRCIPLMSAQMLEQQKKYKYHCAISKIKTDPFTSLKGY